MTYYNTDKYAKALQLFNRDHPQASEAIKHDDALQPGEAVYIPPAGVLQKRYPTATPAPVVSVAPAVPTTTGAPAPAAAPATAPGYRTYHVAPAGERVFDVAQRTLGDGNRWVEIYRLNPRISPDYPIPGNTDIWLPPDARVGP